MHPQKLKIELAYDAALLLLNTYSEELKVEMHSHLVHNHIIHQRQK
jgi:hypothetical protein